MIDSCSARQLYDRIAVELAVIAPVDSGKMFGVPTLKVEGKAFATFFQDAMVFKLSGEAHACALTLSGSQLWDPSGKHRPMKEWVQVPFAHAGQWPELAWQALAYVAGQS